MYFYIKDNTFRYTAIKISPLEFSGTKHLSGAVLVARLLQTNPIERNATEGENSRRVPGIFFNKCDIEFKRYTWGQSTLALTLHCKTACVP